MIIDGTHTSVENIEKKNTMRALFFAFPAECAHTGVGRACTHATQQTDNCREGCRGKTRLDNQHAAAECCKHRRVLEYAGPLLQQNEREDDSEERRHFIKNVCICQYEMVNSVVIAENAECAAGCAYDQQRQVALFPT